jgi:nucleoside-diphosphate-sugar epimerase
VEIANVCVLGGTGFVGQAFAERLCERGLRVRVVTRGLPRSRSLWVLPTVEVVIRTTRLRSPRSSRAWTRS